MYYQIMNLIFDELKEFYCQKDDKLPVFADGRIGSCQFEENFLLPFLSKHKTDFINYFNNAHDVKLVDIDLQISQSESDRRSFADFSFFIDWGNGKVTQEFVNIKFSSFVSADNLCGWKALNYVLFGDLLCDKKLLVFDRLKNQALSQDNHDYWFLVFNKNAHNVFSLFQTSKHTSLLLSIDDLTFNFSQNFPLQLRHSKIKDMTECNSIDKRKQLSTVLLANYKEHHKKQLEIIKDTIKGFTLANNK